MAADPVVRAREIPQGSLLDAYVTSGAYADCYATDVPAVVTHAQFVEAFYTTRLFKLERLLLGLFLSRRSTDAQARQLAQGQVSHFAAWSVEARAENQIVLATGRTRSWLMVEAGIDSGTTRTRLFFGSAVVPRRSASGERGKMGLAFAALLGFHQLYSRALLSSARARLLGRIGQGVDGHRTHA